MHDRGIGEYDAPLSFGGGVARDAGQPWGNGACEVGVRAAWAVGTGLLGLVGGWNAMGVAAGRAGLGQPYIASNERKSAD